MMKVVLKVAGALLLIGFAIWGIASFTEVMMHSSDYLTTGVHYTYDNSNMIIWFINTFSK